MTQHDATHEGPAHTPHGEPPRDSGLAQWLARGRRVFDLAGSAVVLVTTVVTGVTLMAGVLMRYFLGSSLAWGSELPVMLFPWLVMAGVVMAAARHQHLGVDFFVRKVSPGVARVIMSLVQVFIIVLMAVLSDQSRSLLMFLQYQTSPVLGWPASWAFYSLPVGAGGVLLLAIIDLIGLIRGCDPAIEEMSS